MFHILKEDPIKARNNHPLKTELVKIATLKLLFLIVRYIYRE